MQRFEIRILFQPLARFGRKCVLHREPQVGKGLVPLAPQRKNASQIVGRGGSVGMPGAQSTAPSLECFPVGLFRFGVALFFLQEFTQTIQGDQGIGMLRPQCSPFRFECLPDQLLGLRVLAFRVSVFGQVSHGDQRGTMFRTKPSGA